MQIKNVRFSYAMLRGPTEEDDRLVEKGFSVTVRLTPAEALALRVPAIVGYNPQKLLPSPERLAREWHQAMLRLFDFPKSWLDEEIDFSASLARSRTPTFRRLPMIAPGDTLRFSTVPDVSRWNEPDATPLEDLRRFIDNLDVKIVPKPIDFSGIELRALAAMGKTIVMMDRFREATENAQLRLYALGVMLGEPYMPKPAPEPQDTRVSTSAGKRDMSYLKHDRTKNHKRRRR